MPDAQHIVAKRPHPAREFEPLLEVSGKQCCCACVYGASLCAAAWHSLHTDRSQCLPRHLHVLTKAEGVATFIGSIIDTDLRPSNGMMNQRACSMSAQVRYFIKPAWLAACFDTLSMVMMMCVYATQGPPRKVLTDPIVKHVVQSRHA